MSQTTIPCDCLFYSKMIPLRMDVRDIGKWMDKHSKDCHDYLQQSDQVKCLKGLISSTYIHVGVIQGLLLGVG